jgi:toxin FitB
VIILDTNVISEPLKPRANAAVRIWLDQQPKESLYLTAPSLMELLFGIELLPEGKRKRAIAVAMDELLTHFFADRFLIFGRVAAAMYAILARRALAKGSPVSIADCQIAAIATVHGFTVATRDVAPFLACGVPVVNPWEE